MAELTANLPGEGGVAPGQRRGAWPSGCCPMSPPRWTRWQSEELGVDPEELGGSAWEQALISFILFAIGAAIPVFPYLIWSGTAGIIASSFSA